MKLEWGKHLLMGVESLDKEHEDLFKVSKRIREMVYDQDISDYRKRMFVICEGVKYIMSYHRKHAANEEEYMRSIGYIDYVAHKRLHDEFEESQLEKYKKIIESGSCSKEDILDFVGSGVGWLLEHVATADMAIVGKGILARPKIVELNRSTLEREANLMFASALNIEINPKIVNATYTGESIGEAVYHELNYDQKSNPKKILAGVEKSFLINTSHMIYGEDIAEIDALMMATLEMFGANFWRTFGERIVLEPESMKFKDAHVLTQKQIQSHFERKQPTLSVLFETKIGHFFIASDIWPELAS